MRQYRGFIGFRGWAEAWRSAAATAAAVVLAAGIALAGPGAVRAQAGSWPASVLHHHGRRPRPAFVPRHVNFGGVESNTSATRAVFLVNSGRARTGPMRLRLTGPSAGAFAVTADTCPHRGLAPNRWCVLSIRFSPGQAGYYFALLTAVNRFHRIRTSVRLTGVSTQAALAFQPDRGEFGDVEIHTTDTQSFTLSNDGTAATGPLTLAITGPDAAAYSIATTTCDGISLAPQQSCTLAVRFAPATAGPYPATLTADGTNATADLPLTGTGTVAQLAFTPDRGDYGDVAVGDFADRTFTLTNAGTAASGALGLGISGSADFHIQDTNCQATGLAPHDTCTLTVRFAPTSAASQAATLTAHSAIATADLPLTGSGSAGKLYWTIYYNSVTGAFGTINKANLTGTSQGAILDGLGFGLRGIAVDNAHIYYANYADGTIGEANLDGSDPHTIITGASPLGVAVSGTHIYWGDNLNHTIAEANLDGSDPHTLVSGVLSGQLAVDSTHIYWANPYGDTIGEANLDGSDPHTIISGVIRPEGVTVAGTHVYWTSDAFEVGTIGEANLDGSDPHTIVTGQDTPYHMATDGTSIYWTNDSPSTVMAANLDGSDPHVVVTSQNGGGALGIAVGTS